MTNRSMTDQISALHLIIEKAHEFHQDEHLLVAFLNLKAAFDAAHQGVGSLGLHGWFGSSEGIRGKQRQTPP